MVRWKKEREQIQDHKFDFVDIHEFEKHNFYDKIKYSLVFFLVLKAVLVYIADIYTAGALLLTDKWAGGIKPKIPFVVSKWIFVGSIIMSFILLFIEVKKSRRIVASRDISIAFTSIVAYRYYTLTSYPHWCFFQEINNQQRGTDKIAFFVFFAFKGWKRLIFCDGPRQVINAITLYTLFHDRRFTTDISKYGSIFTQASMGVMIFTVSIFFFSACLLLVAFIMYLPLLCIIRGNLKEYCCLLIDKRIAEILKIQREKRLKNNATKPSVDRNRFNGVAPTLPVLDDGMANNKVPAPYTKPPVPYTKTPPPTHPPMHPNHDPYYNGIPLPNDPNIMGRPNVPRNQPPRHFPPQGDPYMGSDLPYDGNPYPEVPYHASPYSPQNKYPYQQQPDYVVGPNDPYYDDYYDDEPYSQPLQPQNTQFIPNNVIQNDSNLPVRYQQNPSSRPYNNHPNSRWS